MSRGTGLPVDGMRLRKARRKAGLSQRQLAETLGTSRKRVILYEQGAARPEVPRLVALARAVGVNVGDIVQEGSLPLGLAGLRVSAGLTLAAAANAVGDQLPKEARIACSRPVLAAAEGGTLPLSWTSPASAEAVRDAVGAAYGTSTEAVLSAWSSAFPDLTHQSPRAASAKDSAPAETVSETTPSVGVVSETASPDAPVEPAVPEAAREQPQVRRAREAWQRLNLRQRAHLTAIFNADQHAEEQVASRRRDWLSVPPAEEWRWQHFSTEAPASVIGRTPIQLELKSQGLLSQGSGSTLAKLRRDCLIEETTRLSSLGLTMTLVRLTRLGRAAARAGLEIPAKKRTPSGMLSEWLFTNVARLYAAGEEGLELNPIKRVPAERFVSDNATIYLDDRRRGGAFIDYGGHGMFGRTVALTPRAIEHYERCWSCYRELYPDVWAPDPRKRPQSAHQGLEAHFRKRPKGLVSRPQWRALGELFLADVQGECPFVVRGLRDGGMRPGVDLARVPHGFLEWELKQVHVSPKAAAALGGRGELVAGFNVGPLLRNRSADADPLWLWHITPIGREHVVAHHRAYADLYPDIDDPTTAAEEA